MIRTRGNSRRIIVVLTVLVGVTALIWAYGVWSNAKAAAEGQAADFDACESMEHEITQLRQQPLQAQAAALESPEMGRRIEQAAKSSGVDTRNIDRIAAAEAHRVKESAFLETPTQVTLSHVTLSQLILFLHALSVGGAGGRDLRISSVRMGAPRGEDVSNTWSAEITVSYLVYSPKIEASVVEP